MRSRNAKRTGPGLAAVKHIIEEHNGTIAFESEEEKGTAFTLTLPQTAVDLFRILKSQSDDVEATVPQSL
ncbi:MAG: ATP-binding protein [Halobacteriota archaeon]